MGTNTTVRLSPERFNNAAIRDLLHAICESNPEAIVITDPETQFILKTNGKAEDLFGCDLNPEDARAVSLKHLLITSTVNAKKIEKRIDFYTNVRESSGFEQMTLLCPEYLNVSVYTMPVRDRQGGIIARLWSFRNLTHQLYLEKQLHQVSRLEMNNRLGITLAHDMKNMLHIILGNLEVESLGQDLEEDSPLHQAVQAAQHCTELTNRLMNHAGDGALSRETCGAQGLMREAVTLLNHMARQNVQIEQYSYDPSVLVHVNKEQILQAILNMCLNAADAMPGGGRIRLRARSVKVEHAVVYGESQRYLALDVEDNGSGIPPDIRPHIFNAFYTTKGHKDGNGLGLYAAQMAVKDHGGWISCESTMEQGTCFTIFLPRVERTDDEEAPTE